MANKFPYEDIINLPPHISAKHPQPTMEERAARFSPFAAITGYEEMVLEEARITEKRIELSDDTKQRLNEKLTMISDFIDDNDRNIARELGTPIVVINSKKYTKKSGNLERLDKDNYLNGSDAYDYDILEDIKVR